MTRSFSFKRLRQRDWAILFIVLSLVAGVLWYFYMYSPTLERISQLESDITRLDADIRRGEDAQNQTNPACGCRERSEWCPRPRAPAAAETPAARPPTAKPRFPHTGGQNS